MANLASRSWSEYNADQAFFCTFTHHFPVLTDIVETHIHSLHAPLQCDVDFAWQTITTAMWMGWREQDTGATGFSSVHPSASGTPTYKISHNYTKLISSWPLPYGSGKATMARIIESRLRPHKKHSTTYARELLWQDSLTPNRPPTAMLQTFPSSIYFAKGPLRTHHQNHNLLFPYPPFVPLWPAFAPTAHPKPKQQPTSSPWPFSICFRWVSIPLTPMLTNELSNSECVMSVSGATGTWSHPAEPTPMLLLCTLTPKRTAYVAWLFIICPVPPPPPFAPSKPSATACLPLGPFLMIPPPPSACMHPICIFPPETSLWPSSMEHFWLDYFLGLQPLSHFCPLPPGQQCHGAQTQWCSKQYHQKDGPLVLRYVAYLHSLTNFYSYCRFIQQDGYWPLVPQCWWLVTLYRSDPTHSFHHFSSTFWHVLPKWVLGY